MASTNQLNVRIKPEHRRKLEAIAAGEGVSIGGAIALLLDKTPVMPVERVTTGLMLSHDNPIAAMERDHATS